MLKIWFIGMYVIFILQQIAIICLVSKLEKYNKMKTPKIYGKDLKVEWFGESVSRGGKK